MTIKIKEVKVVLDTPVVYDYEGDQEHAQFVLIKKPTAKQIGLSSIIKSIFQKNKSEMQMKLVSNLTPSIISAVQEVVDNDKSEAVKAAKSEKEKEDEEGGITDSSALEILYYDPDSVTKLTVAFSEIMRTGLFLLDGEVKMTKPIVDLLDSDDFEKLLCGFVVNFTCASSVKMD